jgi:hypothetical protein
MSDLSRFAQAVEQAEEEQFGAIPAGQYPVVIESAELKPTKTGGEYIACVYQIIDGKFKGRKVWDNLNVVNRNENAQSMAISRLKSICKTLGTAVGDSSLLLNKPLVIGVGIDKRDTTRNTVKSIHKYAGAVQQHNSQWLHHLPQLPQSSFLAWLLPLVKFHSRRLS